jgi:hypothetical protein
VISARRRQIALPARISIGVLDLASYGCVGRELDFLLLTILDSTMTGRPLSA